MAEQMGIVRGRQVDLSADTWSKSVDGKATWTCFIPLDTAANRVRLHLYKHELVKFRICFDVAQDTAEHAVLQCDVWEHWRRESNMTMDIENISPNNLIAPETRYHQAMQKSVDYPWELNTDLVCRNNVSTRLTTLLVYLLHQQYKIIFFFNILA